MLLLLRGSYGDPIQSLVDLECRRRYITSFMDGAEAAVSCRHSSNRCDNCASGRMAEQLLDPHRAPPLSDQPDEASGLHAYHPQSGLWDRPPSSAFGSIPTFQTPQLVSPLLILITLLFPTLSD